MAAANKRSGFSKGNHAKLARALCAMLRRQAKFYDPVVDRFANAELELWWWVLEDAIVETCRRVHDTTRQNQKMDTVDYLTGEQVAPLLDLFDFDHGWFRQKLAALWAVKP